MMLVQSSIDDHGKQESSCIWIPGDESWQEPTNIVPLIEHKKKDDSLWSRNLVSCSQLSTEVNMFETSKPNFVYKRRTIQRNANANVCDILPRSTPTTLVYKRRKIQSDNSKSESVEDKFIGNPKSIMKPTNIVPLIEHKKKDDSLWSRNLVSCSQLSTEVNMFETSKPNFVYKRRTIQRNANANVCDILPRSTPTTLVYKRRKIQSDNSKSGSVEDEFIGNPKSIMKKCSGLHAVNDSCSSSKSNIDLGSVFMKHQVDDVGECSSSGVVIMEGLNSCFSFLKQHGVLERIKTKNKQTSVKKNIYCLKACKVCDRSTSTLNMLICDLCEESFHVSCCNSVIRKVPVGDWFCNFCSRKQLKKIKETNSRKLPKDCLGPIASMLRDVDPYTSNVRIGEDFQVEIPDWSGPLTDELNDYIKHIEINRLDCASYQDWDSSKLSRLSSIGNWLQCREEVDNDGTICGKWRRAPLLEVQTDSWECFSSVLWDPTHADCAVPQELDTDQVLKQLKYIEMLRPRVSAKR